LLKDFIHKKIFKCNIKLVFFAKICLNSSLERGNASLYLTLEYGRNSVSVFFGETKNEIC